MAIIDFTVHPSENLLKLREAVLYVAQRSKDDPRFGAIKLNKILYYADFEAYRQLGSSITNATYQHLAEGPAPKEFLRAKEELQELRAISEETHLYFNHVQKRLVPLRKADLSAFGPEEIRILDEVIEGLEHMNGSDVSAMSHAEWGWRLTNIGEVIPYATAWLSPEPLTQEQIATGIKLWSERNLLTA